MDRVGLGSGLGVGPTWSFDTRAGFLGLSTGPRVAALWLQRSFRLELYQEEESYVSVWPGWMGAATWRPGERWVLGLQGQLLWAYVPVDGAVRAAGYGSVGLSGGYRF